ncbi:predicted protein [Nematostella vectensis]|uniref:Phospholipase B-like n=1 Tax=Nematostella vectensis TaxID=45351 RepID=A7T8N9_NEMVE|nr:predicted protein [Nematostella vectensis]|eukprot:XP_001619746.1 hypothetical protein NEMVEDRAFT_v1g223865 [Nematostella vectensis]
MLVIVMKIGTIWKYLWTRHTRSLDRKSVVSSASRSGMATRADMRSDRARLRTKYLVVEYQCVGAYGTDDHKDHDGGQHPPQTVRDGRPHVAKIYNMSGYPAFAKKHGQKFSYQLAPRAKIFRRDQSKEQKPFRWSDNNFKSKHFGQPDLFNFDFVVMKPDL